MTLPEEAQGAFFAAMANGYAQNVEKTTIHDLPNSKVISWESGDYKLVDFYFTAPHSNKSVGQTVMWHRGVPIWTMQYGGYYEKVAIPFLKECLRQAYITEMWFYGGRGPLLVRGEHFTYINQVKRNDFNDFEGEERICDLSGRCCLGYHWYRGMSLLNDESVAVSTISSPDELEMVRISPQCRTKYAGEFVRPAQLAQGEINEILDRLPKGAAREMHKLLVEHGNRMECNITSISGTRTVNRELGKPVAGKYYRLARGTNRAGRYHTQLWEVRPAVK